MTNFLSLAINGVSTGLMLAVVAIGFIVIFRATGVVNFAGASFLLVGVYVVARLHESIGFVGAVCVGITATGVLAALVDRLIISRAKHAKAEALAILTIGVNTVITTDLVRRMGSVVYSTGEPWGGSIVTIGDLTIPQSRIFAAVACAVLIAAIVAAFRWTTWGLAMRATATDREAAALLGVRLSAISVSAWIVGGVTAVVGGIFLTSFPSPGLDASAAELALLAFPVAILGGLDSVGGALVGGFVIGVTQSLVSGYARHLSFVGEGVETVWPFIVMFIVLIVRPAGLFGTQEVRRV